VIRLEGRVLSAEIEYISDIERRVLDWDVLVSDGGIRVNDVTGYDVTRRGGI